MKVPWPKVIDQIRVAILEGWGRITATEILGHIDFMPARIAAVITSSGGHTHW